MWTINPIQDYIDMWQDLRSMDPKNDIINRPGHTDGCWVWRMHLRLEKLLEAKDFNSMIKKMLTDSGRGKTY
jgi:4-alpha-glucanotransferase